MATNFHTTNREQIAMPALAATMASFDRATLAGFIEVALAVLDCADGDPDIELNGDETDNNHSEDCFVERVYNHFSIGPGCPISDPGGCQHDDREPENNEVCGHYRIDQTTAPLSALWAQPVYPDTIL